MTTRTRILAPFAGWLSALDEVPDPVFAERMMGEGVALDPLEGLLVAPCDARVLTVATTGHSLTLRLASGAELLIHVGIDTVELAGAGFETMVAAGDRVTTGQPLLSFDLDVVARGARSLVTPIVVASPGFQIEARVLGRRVDAGAHLFDLVGERTETNSIDLPGSIGVELHQPVTVGLEHGIHARPAARVAAALAPFVSVVAVELGERSANARSPVALLGLNVTGGAQVTIRASGPDAAPAIAAVAELLAAADPDAGREAVAPAPPLGEGGICASPGLAIGPIAKLMLAPIEVPREGSGSDYESQQLVTARQTASMRLGMGSIAEAHRALIDDPELITIAEREITLGLSAAAAWRAATETHAAILRASGNPRLIERVADLTDVSGQVLTALGFATVVSPIPAGAILVAEDLLPSQFVAMSGKGGLAGVCLSGGGPTSHVAILANAAGVPMVVAAGTGILGASEGTTALLDAAAGTLDLAPTSERIEKTRAILAARAERQRVRLATAHADCLTADGTRIEVFANLASAEEAQAAVATGAEGCGLLRTEFLFLDRSVPPDFGEQRAAYQGIADALGGRPLIVRTLDVGGDKPLAYLPMPAEENPALGARGIRLGLARPELLAVQLAAILAVSPVGQCRIMVPMVVDAGELRRVRAMLDTARQEAGISQPIELGVMIETPAAALLADQLASEADFLSIGTNDLTQYTLAADRGNPATAGLIDAMHPAVLRLIAQTCTAAAGRGCMVGVCGSAAGDPTGAAILVGLGALELSVAPALVPTIKALIGTLTMPELQTLASEALGCDSPGAVRALVRARLGDRLEEAM